MKPKKFKLIISLIAAVLCMAAFSTTAFASGDDWCEYGDYGTQDSATAVETPAPTPTPDPTPIPDAANDTRPTDVTPAPDTGADNSAAISTPGNGTPLTPTGNLNLVDDVVQSNGDGTETETGDDDKSGKPEGKQFITVQSKNGNYFYLIIDRSGDEENVHFLNQVDEADLLALIEDKGSEGAHTTCTCTDKCAVGDINTACPVCQTTMSECTGKEIEPTPTDEPDTEPEKEESKPGNSATLLIVLVVGLAAGGAVYFLKLKKKKPDTKGPVDLDDYDFGEDGDYEFEPDDDEQPDHNKGGDASE